MHPAIPASLLLVAVISAPLTAAPLIQDLPADGSWAAFHTVITFQGREILSEWTLRSVGAKTVGGASHRWIEMEGDNVEGTRVVIKLLVPENAFTPDGNPFDSAREIWAKVGDNEPAQATSLRQADVFLSLIVEGPSKDVKTLDERDTVEWQRGELKCGVTVGGSSTTFNGLAIDVRHRVRQHDEIPFKLAAVTHDFTVQVNDQTIAAKVEMTLKDHGKDAKSVLAGVQ